MKIITQLSCLEIKNKIEKEYESSKQLFFYTRKKRQVKHYIGFIFLCILKLFFYLGT